MILAVADTTPLRYLVEIGYDYLLPRLFTKVWIPGAVASESRQERTPAKVREWEAFELAREIHANLLLIDERTGVRIARERGFTVTGTLGVLVEAAMFDLISIEEALERLAMTNFRRTPNLFTQTLELVRNLGNKGEA